MNKINYTGKSKILKGISGKINWILDHLISDVKVNGESVVSNNVASITVPVNTSDLNNDSGFITKTVNNLTNYYLNTQTYTKDEVNGLIAGITTVHFELVQVLPESGEENIIYLVPAQTTEPDNIYEEWIWISNRWECIGSTNIDLSNYIQKSLTQGLVKNDGTIDTTQYASMSDIPTVNNATLTIQKNGTNVQTFTANASSNKTANITVPTTQADLTEVRLTNEDLNDVTYPGFYYAAGGNTVTNKPTGYNNFGLVVIHNASGSQYTQIISNENGSYRRIKKSNGTWTSWAEDKFTDTTYSAGAGISISARNEISNSGVRSIATGTAFGSLSVNEGGTSSDKTIYMNAPQQSAGQDLNDYKTSGIYYFSSQSPAHQNMPAGAVNGVLIVIKCDWSARTMVKQVFMRHGTSNTNDNQTFVRSFGVANNAWSYWHEMVTSKPTSTSSDNDVLFEMNGRNGKAADAEAGTEAVMGHTYVNIGNSTAYPSAGNSRGSLRIYGGNTRFIRLTVKDDMSNSFRSVLPSVTCNLAPNYVWSYYGSVSLSTTSFKRISTNLSSLSIYIFSVSVETASNTFTYNIGKYIPYIENIHLTVYEPYTQSIITMYLYLREGTSYYEAEIDSVVEDGFNITNLSTTKIKIDIYEQVLEPVT